MSRTWCKRWFALMQSEAMIEEPARGRHQGRATRQEDALNLFGR